MSDCTINGSTVSTCSLEFPLIGASVLNCTLATEAPLAGSVVLAWGSVQWHGTVVESRVWAGLCSVYAVSGKARLHVNSLPNFLVNASIKTIADSIVGSHESVGEAPATKFDKYTVMARPISLGIEELCRQAAVHYRFRDDGKIWIGPETWPQGDNLTVVTDENYHRTLTGLFDSPTQRPGQVVNERQAHRVRFDLMPTKQRATIFYG